jgi:hypothetical protein
VPADDAAKQSIFGDMLEATVLLVAYAERVNQRQAARLSSGPEAVAQGLQQNVGDGMAGARSADRDRAAVCDQAGGVWSGNNSRHRP